MTRRHLPAASLVLLSGILLAVLSTASGTPGPPQEADKGQGGARDPAEMIKGKWRATLGGQSYTLDLRLDEGALVGTVELPNRKTVNIEDGIFVVDEFSFTTVENEVEWEWNGTISEAGLEGERERFDTDARETFTAKRQP